MQSTHCRLAVALTVLLPLLLLLLLLSVPGSAATSAEPEQPSEDASRQHQEALLGKDAVPEFNRLSPEAARAKLTELLARIDTNSDRLVSLAEMVNWMREVAQRERLRSAEARFRNLKEASSSDKPAAAPLSFEDYERAMQRELLAGDEDGNRTSSSSDTAAAATALASLSALMDRSRRRWARADVNADGALTAAEFADFLRPEESPRMREVVIQEALGNADSNGDGRLDMGEHLRDLYPDYDRDRREGRKLPDWVAKEETHFKERLDLDKNGSLDPDEIYKLVVPESADHATTESNYLFDEADANRDGFLSQDEVLKNWGLFVGHGATNFGAFDHQEL